MDKFEQEIKKQLSSVSDKGKILFAALTSEKLYPNYVFFQKITDWGNSEFLMEGISLTYQSLMREGLFSKEEIEEVMENVDQVTPDVDDFNFIETSFALDACTSVYSMLSFLLDKDIEHIISVAIYARDTVYMFLGREYDDPDDNDPLMLREMTRQRELLQKLKILNLDTLTDEMIEGLRGKTPIIDLGMLEN